MNISGYIYAALACLVVLIGYFVYSLYQDNKILRANEVKYLASIELQQKTIDSMKKDIEAKDKINDDNQKIVEVQRTEKEDLINKFNKEKTVTVTIEGENTVIIKQRDLGELAKAKPKMVQNIINKGTVKEFDCIEYITDPNNSGDCK